jgi:hypothetical protein
LGTFFVLIGGRMKWAFENSAKLFSILSFWLLALSTFHDWGYFLVIDPKLRSVQTTFDYISNAIEWLPPFALFLIVAIALFPYIVMEREERKTWVSDFVSAFITSENRDHTTSKKRNHTTSEKGDDTPLPKWVKYIIVFLILVFLFAYFTAPFPLNLVFLSVSLTFLLGFVVQFARQVVLSDRVILAAMLASVLFLLVFMWGVFDGLIGLHAESNYRISMKDQKDGEPRQVTILRSFEKGLLVRRASSDQVEFVRWESVEQLSHTAPGGCTLPGLPWCEYKFVPPKCIVPGFPLWCERPAPK